MLDIIGIALFARSRGKIAEQKGQPAGTYVGITAALGFGGEILGAVVGFVGEGGAGPVTLLFGLCGAVLGCGIASVIVDRAPDIRDPDRVGPSSMKVQIAGSTCTLCQKNIPTALDGASCPRCGDVVHLACGPSHDEAKHPEAADYRSNAKKRKKKTEARATEGDGPAAV